ncbi:hypothetical protein DB345_12320 [Spartobacteria bacterium LR76]|nr:hypothetical protein DB345_12320 [Spartobacteria bacterium LR76]
MKPALSHPGRESAVIGRLAAQGRLPRYNPDSFLAREYRAIVTAAASIARDGREPHIIAINERIEANPMLCREMQETLGDSWATAWQARADSSLAFGAEGPILDCLRDLEEAALERESQEATKQHAEGHISRSELLDRLTAIEKSGRSDSGDVSDLFADVGKILSAGLDPERPTVAEYATGSFLFYAGRLNEIHGEPGTGKSNINLLATMTVLATGQPVLYIDPEDSAEAAIRRLLGFGCPEDVIRDHFKHTRCPAGDDYARLASWATANKPPLVIVDGLAEALAADGLSEDKPEDFLKFCRERLQPFTDAGAAVVLSDHVVKSAENRGRWSRGTGAKLGRYDGVSYAVELGQGYSPTVEGFVRLSVAKDRNGGVGVVGQSVTEIHFSPMEAGLTRVTFKKPTGKSEGRFLPTALMEKVSRQLETVPTSSARDLRALGKSDFVDRAIRELVAMGNLQVTPGGIGRSNKYKLIKPYREDNSDV